ncbi:hypothetical protein [Bacillus alveayuensis]|jgi:uncharacterized iron-regulated membrane protein|nr:hypothetical protein [Bacillus alveayuensis]
MSVIVKIHGELMVGTIGDRLIELSLIFVFLVDWLIVKRIPKLQLWLS